MLSAALRIRNGSHAAFHSLRALRYAAGEDAMHLRFRSRSLDSEQRSCNHPGIDPAYDLKPRGIVYPSCATVPAPKDLNLRKTLDQR